MSSKKGTNPIETRYPTPLKKGALPLSNEKKIAFIQEKIADILDCLGLDISHESLKETPERVARMYVEEIYSGLDPKNFPEVTFFHEELTNKSVASHMISVKASFISHCEHHLVPMVGTAFISYLPKDKVIGLSKFSRIVRFFAARPQLQERLTAQIADSLTQILETEDVAVAIEASHFCMIARGVQDPNSSALTHHLQGKFLTNESLKRDFFSTLREKNREDR